MVEITLLREYQEKQTIGRIDVGDFVFTTMELPWLDNKRRISCIPEGTYRVVKHNSPTFGKCFWLPEVPGRSEILIHYGNFVHNYLGCIGVGRIFARDVNGDGRIDKNEGDLYRDLNGDGLVDIGSTKPALKKLLEIMPDEFYLHIKKAA